MKNLSFEVWKDIAGFEGFYQVSSEGRVRSLRYKNKGLLKLQVAREGYEYVNFSVKGDRSRQLVHRLVAGTFLKNPKELPCVNHKNGAKRDNKVSNLEWVSYSENLKHAYTTGLRSATGSKNGMAILKEEYIPIIRRLIEEGLTLVQIARVFEITPRAISQIKDRKNWSHV